MSFTHLSSVKEEGSTIIRELLTESERLEAFPVLQELRTHLSADSYLEYLNAMTLDGYRLFALYEDQQMAALAGIAIRTNFYYGKHIFVYDLVTRSIMRSQGYGEKILAWIHQFAKEQECGIVALESGLFRENAHRFYETKMGYEKFCYSFKKIL